MKTKQFFVGAIAALLASQAHAYIFVPVPAPKPVVPVYQADNGAVVTMTQPASPMPLTYAQNCVGIGLYNAAIAEGVCNFYNGTNAQSSIDSFTVQWNTFTGSAIVVSQCAHANISGNAASNFSSCPLPAAGGGAVTVNGLIMTQVGGKLGTEALVQKIISAGAGKPAISLIQVVNP
jgi:hypothetical protein